MQPVVLGKSGISVSPLGFGALFTAPDKQGRAAVARAIECGVNYFDTAPAYGDSEKALGEILADLGTKVVVSTKVGGRPQPFDARDPACLRRSVENSLRALRREALDILLIHEPDRPGQYDWWTEPEQARGPVTELAQELKTAGLIRSFGLAGTTATELGHFIRAGDFDVVLSAFNYSALYREAVHDVLPAAAEKQLGVILGSVLQQGALGRRFDEVVRAKPAWLAEPRRRQFLAFYDLLDQSGLSIVELGLRFAVTRPVAHTILIGPKNLAQMTETLDAFARGPLPTDVLIKLDEIAAMVPFRPFEEPMLLPFSEPKRYYGPGPANVAR